MLRQFAQLVKELLFLRRCYFCQNTFQKDDGHVFRGRTYCNRYCAKHAQQQATDNAILDEVQS